MLNQDKPEIKTEYLTLSEVAQTHKITMEQLRYFAEEGLLAVCLRKIPVQVAVEKILDKSGGVKTPNQCDAVRKLLHSPQPIHTTDIYRIFANTPVKIKISRLKTMPVMKLVKVIAPPLVVGIDDLVIMAEESARFAALYLNRKAENPLVILSRDFMHFVLYGKEYNLGQTQANVIRLLYEAYCAGNPWLHCKKLLSDAGSRSEKIHNLFSDVPWRNIIKRGGGGWYMLNLPTDKVPPASLHNPNQLTLF